jgi:hypothetical protein
MSSKREIEPSDLREFKQKLMCINGVQAVGESVSDGLFCLKVFFDHERSMRDAVLPELGPVPIVCTVSGSIETQ